jgi:hypothetical protein
MGIRMSHRAIASLPTHIKAIALLITHKAIASLLPQEKRSPTSAQANTISLIATNYRAIAPPPQQQNGNVLNILEILTET